MKKIKTNVDLVNDLMTHSPVGALGQAFIIQAIREYAEELVANPLPPTKPGSLFSNEAWNKAALDVRERCNAFYNPHKVKGEEEV